MTLFIISCLNNFSFARNCLSEGCHKNIHIKKEHLTIGCTQCHLKNKKHYSKILSLDESQFCFKCHKKYERFLHSNMVTRKREKKLINSWFGKYDPAFYETNCQECHVTSCFSCHKTHNIKKNIGNKVCLNCHNGYFIGTEYLGYGIKDEHKRYQVGIKFKNRYYMKMLPDVHYEKGIACSDCHNMKSISKGESSSKTCKTCHKKLNMSIIEHSIEKHLTSMECYTCHSAWEKIEMGTFWLKFEKSFYKFYYRNLTLQNRSYVKSSFLRENSMLFGVNTRGKVSPIRPEFINFFTFIKNNKVIGKESKLISNDFKAVFPHTVRRETVNCEFCHDNKKIYLYQDNSSRIFYPELDGMSIKNLYDYRNYHILNGRFVNDTLLNKILKKDKKYKKLYLKKIKSILKILEF